MKLGTIGVRVKIIPPGAELPDDFEIRRDVEVEDYVPDDEGVEELLAGENGAEPAEAGDEPDDTPAAEEVVEPAEEVVEPAEEVVEPAEEAVVEPVEGAPVEEDLDEETAQEAEELLDEMEGVDDE
jgi:small subunit ribosomal protein S3